MNRSFLNHAWRRKESQGGEPLTAQGSGNRVITWYVLSR
jgi:hypothetical protein